MYGVIIISVYVMHTIITYCRRCFVPAIFSKWHPRKSVEHAPCVLFRDDDDETIGEG